MENHISDIMTTLVTRNLNLKDIWYYVESGLHHGGFLAIAVSTEF
jgi:hypothetical protein